MPSDMHLSALSGCVVIWIMGSWVRGFLELDNNTAERSMGGIAKGCKNYMFVGSERGARSAAIIYTLTETAKLNSVDPQV